MKIAIITTNTASVPRAERLWSMKRLKALSGRGATGFARASIGSSEALRGRLRLMTRRRGYLYPLRMREPLHIGDQALGGADFLFRRLQRDHAAIHHHEALGDVEDVVDVVADEQHRPAAGAHARTKRNTFSVSVSDSAVVGSSITMRSALL